MEFVLFFLRAFLGFVDNSECCNMQQSIWMVVLLIDEYGYCYWVLFGSTNNKQCHQADDDFFYLKC
jgi:hypothetical protein